MSNAFEYGDTMSSYHNGNAESEEPPISPNQPYLNLATFRMVVLADEVLESFFETDLTASFELVKIPPLTADNGLLGGLVPNFVADEGKKLFYRFADEIGKTMGRHQVQHRPSIGKFNRTLEEPKVREPLIPSTLRSQSSSTILAASSTTSLSTTSTATPEKTAVSPKPATKVLPSVPESPTSPPVDKTLATIAPLVDIANAAMMQRPAFVIDEAKGDESDSDLDSEEEEEDDEAVMDEVDAFLEEHDSGLTASEKKTAQDLLNASPIK
jgi:hypothetical protein